MTSDRTEHQTSEQQRKAQELSLKPTRPPGQVPGYTVQGFIGSGAYGEVWSGTDRNTGRPVAIKFYTRRSSLDVTMLSREVEKLVVLAANRYVVQLLDVGWDTDPPYYVMDYIENGSLEDKLKQTETLSVAEATELFEEIAQGLVHLHGKGILHCDLKPGNVLLDQDLKPRLADFGQSRLSHEQSPALGTLFYMAPEQADLDAVPDARWDVYALGALLYSMLTGEPPYREPELVQKLESTSEIGKRLRYYRHSLQSLPKPTAHRKVPGVDRMLADIVDRCIAADPKDRYTSVHSVMLALQQREQVHATRPLKVLGILGPLLLLTVISVFGWNAYSSAITETDSAITEKAVESSGWAAQLAARSAAEQIDQYFAAVRKLANDDEFKKRFAEVVTNDEVKEFSLEFADPNRNGDASLDKRRTEFERHSVRSKLQKPLVDAMADPEFPKAASWFVCDRHGTQVASKFDTESAKRTLGKNYSYRSYFNNTDRDFFEIKPDGTKFFFVGDLDDRKHIVSSHLSGIFQSDATATWKIAFSTPLYLDGEFAGVLAVTVEMGHFVEFKNVETQYAMMIDGRPGEHGGIVLEHPLLDDVINNRDALKRLSQRRVDLAQLEGDRTNFVDPMGSDSLGEPFRGRWVAGVAEVERVIDQNDNEDPIREPTGLKVIAVEDYESVIEPVHQLTWQLVRIAFWAIVVLLVVGLLLMYFLFRALRQSRRRLSRAYVSQTESTSLNSVDTLPQMTSAPTGRNTQ